MDRMNPTTLTAECLHCGKAFLALAQCSCAKARKADREMRKARMAAEGRKPFGLAS